MRLRVISVIAKPLRGVRNLPNAKICSGRLRGAGIRGLSSTSFTKEPLDIEKLLLTWPHPLVREAINQTIREIGTDENMIKIARENHHIDSGDQFPC